jgi:hypothetical protein
MAQGNMYSEVFEALAFKVADASMYLLPTDTGGSGGSRWHEVRLRSPSVTIHFHTASQYQYPGGAVYHSART